MRLVTVISFALLAWSVGSALADKNAPPEKPWHYDYGLTNLTVVPEQEPNDVCPGQAVNLGDVVAPASYNPASDDDWYQFYAMAGTVMVIGTDSYNGSDVDTYLQLYDSDCSTLLAYDDDGGPNMFSLISGYEIPHDGTYHIKTYTYSHLYTGDYQLLVTGGPPPPPDPNDTCNPGFVIPLGSGVIQGDMSPDHNDYDPGSGGCATGYPEAGKDVAYRMDLRVGDIVDMTYTTPNSDAAFYVVTDCSDPAGTCVVGADAGYDTEVIHWWVTQTGTYYVILDHYGVDAGAGPWSLSYFIPYEIAACCVGDLCYMVPPEDCAAMGGTFMGWGVSCDPNPCLPEPTGACCVEYVCTIQTQNQCILMGGTYYGDGSVCDPTPCPPTPVEASSWGKIKARYR